MLIKVKLLVSSDPKALHNVHVLQGNFFKKANKIFLKKKLNKK